jgi:hypothetical protein
MKAEGDKMKKRLLLFLYGSTGTIRAWFTLLLT